MLSPGAIVDFVDDLRQGFEEILEDYHAAQVIETKHVALMERVRGLRSILGTDGRAGTAQDIIG